MRPKQPPKIHKIKDKIIVKKKTPEKDNFRLNRGQFQSFSEFFESKDILDDICVNWHQCRKCVSMDTDLNVEQG